MNYDYIAEFSCFGGTAPCQPTTRGYLIRYPSIVRINLSASQDLLRPLAVCVSVEDLNNNTSPQAFNFGANQGRITMLGLRLHY